MIYPQACMLFGDPGRAFDAGALTTEACNAELPGVTGIAGRFLATSWGRTLEPFL